MADTTSTVQDSQVVKTTAGPGELLMKTRTSRQLTQQAVAQALHLKEAIVEALENDDYARLPEPIYVKGYLKNYARLLGIAAEPLINQYQAGIDERDELPEFLPPERNREPVGHKINKYLLPTTIATMALLAALIFYIVPRDDDATPEIIQAQDKAETAIADEQVEIKTSEPEASEAPVTVEVAPEPLLELDTSQEQPEVMEPAEQSADYPVLGADLVFYYDDESWTEVKDATGKRLLFDLMRPGSIKTIHGIAPFEVLLGNARGVRVELNNDVFNHTRYIRGDSARFRLGSEEDNTQAP